jgi:hypothetical protein
MNTEWLEIQSLKRTHWSEGISVKEFRYDPLPSANTIRLIELLPGKEYITIECRVIQTYIDEAAEFEALSYVWGDPCNKVGIFCNGRSVKITRNLYRALQCFRLKSKPRRLWVDAISIDQSNLQERNSQVAIMASIYKRAQKVLVWLGPDDHSDQAAIRLIEKIGRTYCSNHGTPPQEVWNTHNLPRVWDFIDPKILPPPHSFLWDDLFRFFELPYFCRVWVIQEIQSNPVAVARCGDAETDFTFIQLSAVCALQAPVEIRRKMITDRGISNAISMRTLLTPNRNLLARLDQTRGFYASDRRDKIFPFLCPKDSTTVDYTKSIIDIFSAAATQMLYENGLECLSYVFHNRAVSEKFPSWLPRFDYGFIMPFCRVTGFSSGGCNETTWQLEGQRLKLRGIRVDQLKRVEPIMSWSRFDLSSGKSWSRFDYVSEEQVEDDLLRTWRLYTEGDAATQPYISGGTLRTAFSFSISAGLRTWSGTHDILDHQMSFETYNQRLLEAVSSTGTISHRSSDLSLMSVSITDEVLEMHWSKHSIGEYSWQGNNIDWLNKANNEDEERVSWQRYQSAIQSACNNRRVFSTEKGYVGLGPNSLNMKAPEPILDEIWVILGARTPFVLRPKGNAYQLVGECYIHGLMQGEALHEVKAGNLAIEDIEIC